MSRRLFLIVITALAIQRLLELRLSRRNERRLLEQGAREVGAGHFGLMKALHTIWFLAMIAEVYLLGRPFRWSLATIAALLALLGQSLRYAAIRTLGSRWTVRIIVLPGAQPIQHGIYRRLRHPNYLGVILEIAAVPLLHSAYLTSIIFTIANALLLQVRTRAEERALALENDYALTFAARPRFLPHL